MKYPINPHIPIRIKINVKRRISNLQNSCTFYLYDYLLPRPPHKVVTLLHRNDSDDDRPQKPPQKGQKASQKGQKGPEKGQKGPEKGENKGRSEDADR